MCGFVNIYPKKVISGFPVTEFREKIDIKNYLIRMSENLYSTYYGALWNKMYILDIIKKNEISFSDNVSYGEDFIFNLRYLEYVKNIYVISDELYYYCHENETSLTKEKDQAYLWQQGKIRYSFCVNQYKKLKTYERCKSNIMTAIANELIGPTYSIVNSDKTIKQKILDLKKIYSETLAQDAVKFTKTPTMVHRIASISMKIHSFSAFYILMKIWIPIQKRKK